MIKNKIESVAQQFEWAVVRKWIPHHRRMPPSTPSVLGGNGTKRNDLEALCEPVQYLSPITVQTLHNTQEGRSYHLRVLDAGAEAAAFMVDPCLVLD